MFRLAADHIQSLFHRLTSAFEHKEDKRFSLINSTKLHVVNFNDTNVGTGNNVIFDIEADTNNPVYVEFNCYVDTVFNAVTTNVLTMGSNVGVATNVFAGADINEAVVGINGPKWVKLTARTKFYVSFTSTGGGLTTGKATFMATIRAAFDK